MQSAVRMQLGLTPLVRLPEAAPLVQTQIWLAQVASILACFANALTSRRSDSSWSFITAGLTCGDHSCQETITESIVTPLSVGDAHSHFSAETVLLCQLDAFA